MKSPQPFLLPTLCFAIAVALGHAGRHAFAPTEPEVEALDPGRMVSSQRQRQDHSAVASLDRLQRLIAVRPSDEWSALWDEFAGQAVIEDLQTLAGPPMVGREPGVDSTPTRDPVLEALAREELALRATGDPPTSPAAIGALAEADPAAAFRALERLNRSDLALAAWRTMARRDPAGTLDRILTLPNPVDKHWDETRGENRSGVYLTPVAGLFAGWARHDPQAAVAALGKLPPDLRTEAAEGLALTWAFHDGPAAVRFLIDFWRPASDRDTPPGRLDVMLRAALRTHPQETAALMREDPRLRQLLPRIHGFDAVTPRWFHADPETVSATFEEILNQGGTGNTFLRDGLLQSLSAEPEAKARLIRGLVRTGHDIHPRHLRSLEARDPNLARELAHELGMPDPGSLPLASSDPATDFDTWLAALREHGDPDSAQAALGWPDHHLVRLADLAIRFSPKKAEELGTLVPASWMADRQNGRPSLARLWPELDAPRRDGASASSPAGPSISELGFRYDPVFAAEALLDMTPWPSQSRDLREAIQILGSYEPAHARAWLARIPHWRAREEAWLVIVAGQAGHDPLGTIRELLQSGRSDPPTIAIWQTSLFRLAASGGDWQTWLSRAPQAVRDSQGGRISNHARLVDALAAESSLLELLANP